ncbi:MAG TPA: hypothetical protein VFE67_04075 [Rudaea sp.]|jgi:hypothetical protein|nr:hypothetical protein [Rudaea sp.]
MDIYLPADFHALHDTAPDDWRDISASSATQAPRQSSGEPFDARAKDSPDACADPLWRVI